MTDTFTCSGWACTDCLILLANGEVPPDMSEAEAEAWQSEIDTRNAGFNLTLGMLREDHSDDCDPDSDCDCETQTFSWSACDVCGSNLGGSRHAVSFWKIDSTGGK